MSNLNYIFFEEYKRLDKLCGELYGDQHGISHYIDDMKNVPTKDCQYISGWKDDLEKLIRLRHIRNYLAHTEGAFNERICTQKDIEWSQEFHERILNRSDPLSKLYQYSKPKQQRLRAKPSPTTLHPFQPSPQNDGNFEKNKKTNSPTNKKRRQLYWIMILLMLVWFLLLVILIITILFE